MKCTHARGYGLPRLPSVATTFATCVAFAWMQAHARDADAAEPAENTVEQVTVKGSAVGGFSTKQTIDDASREVTDAASLIEAAPGVHVRRLGADDSFASLSIRGTSSTEVFVYLAGVPLSGGADPSLDLATLPLWPGASARVYRSFSPAALGRGSLGGVLTLDPPSIRGEERTESWTAVGSFGAVRMRIGDIRQVGDVRIATALSASRADDNFSYVDFNRGNTPQTLTRQNSGHADANGLMSIGAPVTLFGKTGAVTLTTLAQSRRQQLPGTIDAPTFDARLDSSRLVSAIELTLPAPRGAFIARTWGRREGFSISDDALDAARAEGPTHTNDAIVAAGMSTGYRGRPIDALSIDTRLDASTEKYAPSTWTGVAQTPPGAAREQAGLALDAEYIFSEHLRFGASGRLDQTTDEVQGGAATSTFVPTGHVGVEVPLPYVTLAAHGGALSRPASFVERYGDRGAFLGDPSLLPESADTIDLGARGGFHVGAFSLAAEIASFATWAENLIVFVPQGAYGRAKATNIGRARLLGAEANMRAKWRIAELRASYTGLSTENEAECSAESLACERPPLPGRPSHDVVIDAIVTLGPARFRYGVDYVSGVNADFGGTILVPERLLQSAGVRVAVPHVRNLTLAFDARNLFDVRTGTYAGVLGPVGAPIGDLYEYPLPGRSFLLSVKWSTKTAREEDDAAR